MLADLGIVVYPGTRGLDVRYRKQEAAVAWLDSEPHSVHRPCLSGALSPSLHDVVLSARGCCQLGHRQDRLGLFF